MEAGNKYFHEVVHLLAATRFKRRFQSRFCQQEFIISGNDSNLLIVFYVQIMPDDFVMQLHRF